MRRDPNRSVFDLSGKVGRLVGLAHPYVPASERSDLIVEDLIDSLDNRTFRCHLLTADTSTVAKVAQAIDDYLTVRSSDRPTCMAIREEGEPGQLAKLAEVLIIQAGTLTTQSERLSAQAGVLSVQSEANGPDDGMTGSIGECLLHAAVIQQESLQ